MGMTPSLDIDLLRSFVVIAEEGSFTRAAERIGRTQSAVSLQVQRLEAQIGHRVFVRAKGGAVRLSSQGEYLLSRAQEVLSLNDDIVGSLRALAERGSIRLGFPHDYLGLNIRNILTGLYKACSGIAVEVLDAPSCSLLPILEAGDLDLMVCEAGNEPPRWPNVELWRGDLRWITSDKYAPHRAEPLPLSISPEICPWRPSWLNECRTRGAALRALKAAGRRYRIVASAPTYALQQAAVRAGLAVMVSPLPGLPHDLRAVRPEEGLPELPETWCVLLKSRRPRQPATDILAEHIVAAFRTISSQAVGSQQRPL